MFHNFLYWFIPFTILPIEELYAWSNNQKIHILFHKVNEIIKRCKEYDEAFKELKDLLNDLDNEVRDEVERILNGWLEDDTIKNILENILPGIFEKYEGDLNELRNYLTNYTNIKVFESEVFNANKHATVDFERMFRVVKDTAHFMFDQPSISSAADDTRTEKLSFAQGGCHFYENGEERFATMYISNDGSKFSADGNGVGSAYTGNALLEVYNRRGNVIRSKVIYGVAGHAQTLCYHNGYFYFEGHNPLDEYAFRKIRRISADLTGDISSYLMPYGFNGLASYGGILWMAYATNTEIDVWKVEMESDGVTPTTNVLEGRTMQPSYLGFWNTGGYRNTVFSAGFSVTRQYFYFGTHNPTGILRCKRVQSSGVEGSFYPDYWYSIPDMLNDREVKTGELEFMTIYDDFTCFIGTTQHLNTKAVCQGDITQFFVQNLKTNTCLPIQFENPKTGRKQIYCSDPTVRNASTNPFGTSWEDGFTRMDEACWYFNNNEKYNYGVFNFDGSFGHIAWCSAGKSYRFNGDNNNHPHAKYGDDVYTLIGNLIQFGGDVTCYGCVFASSIHYLASSNNQADVSSLMSSYSQEKKHPIYSCDGNINLINSGVIWTNNPNIAGAMYIRNAVGNYNYTNSSKNYMQGAFRQANPSKHFINIGNSIINFHEDVGCSATDNGMEIAWHNQLAAQHVDYPNWYKNLIK